MDWTMFQKRGEAPTKAFEAFMNQLFELWCRRTYRDSISYFTVVNGSGGDGGVEAYAMLLNNTFVGVQSKWFIHAIGPGEINQIRNSIKTAMKIRPKMKHYIVCIPRDLASKKGKVQTTEQDRWDRLILEMNTSFPDLTIELWNESKLRDEVQKDQTGNVYRYWFEKNEISLETLKQQFAKARSGWLNQRYIPSLHGQGLMQSALHYLVGAKSKRVEALEALQKCDGKLDKLISEIQFGQTINKNKKLNNELKKVERFLQQMKANVHCLRIMIQYNGESIDLSPYDYPDINKCLTYLKDQPIQSVYSINQSDLEKTLQTINQMDVEYEIDQIHEKFSNNQILILGEPGTGKTHGLANGVQQYLEVEQKPALIIHAKRYGSEKSWRDILFDALGISSNWSEDEIWRGLEACAARCDIRDSEKDNQDVKVATGLTQVLVCVDGLDESIPWDRWKERIGELEAIQRNYRRLKFAVTSRPYVYNEDSTLKTLRLPTEGDTSVDQLFPSYIEFYNITFTNPGDVNWLRWSIKTPLALRLFCDQHKGKELSNLEKVSFTIAHLLRDKIDAVDKEITTRLGDLWGLKDHVVLSALITIANRAVERRIFDRAGLCNIIIEAQSVAMIDERNALRLVDYMVGYGLLSEFVTSDQDPLIPPARKYEIALQPIMDYLLAMQLVDKVIKENDNDLPKELSYRQGTIQMAAIILLQDHKRLVGKDGLWNNSTYMDLFDLQLFTLANVTPDRTKPYADEVKKIITHSMSASRKLVNQLMVKVARIKYHPLGPILLHETLNEIKTVAERDLVWSVPEYLPRKNNAVWEGSGKIFVNNVNNGLIATDTHDGLPLLYAWQLTNVDNRVRQTCRKEISKWGQRNPTEFILLINLSFSANDPQMKEDVMSCAFAVASTLTNQPELKALADWALEEVFAESKIKEVYNAVILYAGRAIVERAYLYGHVEKQIVEKARPPFPASSAYLPIDVNAAQADSDIFGPISMDLGWYVIKRGYTDFFVTKQSKRVDEESIDTNQWAALNDEELDWVSDKIKDGQEKDSLKTYVQQREKEMGESQKQYRSIIGSWKDHLMVGVDTDEDEDFLDSINEMDINEELRKSTFIPVRYEDDAHDLLEGHALENGLDSLTPHQLALGFVMSFIYRMGWKEKVFHGQPNGDQPGEVIGVDVAIMRKYHTSTHGSQSTVMQFAEKYTWCAVHEMLGYFANRIPLYVYGDNGREAEMIDDYSLLLDIPNPLQELSDVSLDERREQMTWFVPNELSPTVSHLKSHKKWDIIQWLRTAPFPDLSEWIKADESKLKPVLEKVGAKGNWVSLYNFSAITEPHTLSDSIMWIKSCAIKQDNFDQFILDCSEGNPSLLSHFKQMDVDFFSSPRSKTYMDPSSLAWMTWMKEDYQIFQINSVENNKLVEYPLYKTVVETTHRMRNGDVEYTFQLPSKLLREFLYIREGDGWCYYNKDNQLVAFHSLSGQAYRNSQSLLYVNQDLLEQALDKHGYKMIWGVRILREPSMKVRDQHNKFFPQRDTTWIVYEDSGVLRELLVKDEES
ncbi:hypothetical protein [Rossellomorea marisflavi]|uniref:hypothetical protein n=1 Tax=Rossellomorea marisflavi TaxID=189381 RepID=UPI0011E80AAC|nr:hypothetical protein [Rossellomorea marisflavi]TYO68681.1 hypothetical protein DQ398_003858 [Rossellomorea marisflavi]